MEERNTNWIDLDVLIKQFIPGLYRHYKGKDYLAMNLVRHHDSGEVFIVYCPLYVIDDSPVQLTVREIRDWYQDVIVAGLKLPRFSFVEKR